MPLPQPGILPPIAASGRYVTLSLASGVAARDLLDRLRRLELDDSLVVGLGEPFTRALDKSLPGLRTFPALSGPGPAIPSTQAALFLHTRSDDPGRALRTMMRALDVLGAGVRVEEDILGFKHDTGRDLSGYEDGTENPKGAAAAAAAFTADGSSFVAAQRWVHDLPALERLDPRRRDDVIGRNRETNAELADAPTSAHVRRSQQEGFDPPAFMLRRSMPYGTVREHGLYFVAYVAALSAFERVLARMVGLDDGVADALFGFSRAVSGGYYWCPPVTGARLELAALD